MSETTELLPQSLSDDALGVSDVPEPEPEWRSLDTDALVSYFSRDGDWPPPALLEEILLRKDEAVGPLVSVVEQSDPAGLRAYQAAELLILLRNPIALPAIAKLFHDSDEDTAESLEMGLPEFGPAAFPHLLPFVRDRALTWYQRAMAIEVLKTIAFDDEGLKRELAETLEAALSEYIDEGDQVSSLTEEEAEDYFEVVSMLVSDLADIGAEEARPLIRRAFDEDLVDTFVVGADILDKPFFIDRRGRRSHDWMKWYVDAYAHRNDPPKQYPARTIQPDRATSSVRQTTYIAPPKPGRNDPCWCGSGKKYKKCHLAQPDDKFARS